MQGRDSGPGVSTPSKALFRSFDFPSITLFLASWVLQIQALRSDLTDAHHRCRHPVATGSPNTNPQSRRASTPSCYRHGEAALRLLVDGHRLDRQRRSLDRHFHDGGDGGALGGRQTDLQLRIGLLDGNRAPAQRACGSDGGLQRRQAQGGGSRECSPVGACPWIGPAGTPSQRSAKVTKRRIELIEVPPCRSLRSL